MLNRPRNFSLRWRYDFHDRAPIYGMWSNPGSHLATQAWCQNKEGLKLASVQGKNIVSGDIVTLAECPGQDFRVFQWMAAARFAPGFTGTPRAQLIGMKILARDREIIIFDTGDVLTKPLEEGERLLNFATYGK